MAMIPCAYLHYDHMSQDIIDQELAEATEKALAGSLISEEKMPV